MKSKSCCCSCGQTKETQSCVENKEAIALFNSVWTELEKEPGREKLIFPKQILWLNGAPGAGKGTHTQFILKHLGFSKAIVISDLLTSPEAKKIKDSGGMVGDKEVMGLLFRALIAPDVSQGTIVDGFPRTAIQVDCLKLLNEKLACLYNEFKDKNKAFSKPDFHILALFVDEAISVKRQIGRGLIAIENNKKIDATGKGVKEEIRKTDTDPEAAKHRYQVYMEMTHAPLQTLRGVFPYHHLDASGTIPEVEEQVRKELKK